jgi:EmrB/QacA subfamily drug resistance transporter
MFPLTEKNRKWWILLAMTSAISMTFIDVTVLPVALPSIQRTLGISEVGLQWIVNAYTLSLCVFLLAGGRLGDRFGLRKVLCWGLALFVLGSVLCGLSYFEGWFIASRFLQGIGGAMMIPTSSTIVFNAFPPRQRGKALGLNVSIGSVFLAMGPFIGGIFTQYFSWRLVFWINVPIALIGYALVFYAVPKMEGKRRPFDLGGFLASSLGIIGIIIALMQGREWGWFSPWTMGCLIFGTFLILLLWKLDRNVEDPYIDFTFFKNRNFLGASMGIFCTQFLLMVTVFWALYFQNILGFSPSQAGTLSLISNAPLILAAPIGGHLLDKHGPKIPITIGFLLLAASLFWFILNIGDKSVLLICSALIPFGCGMPLIFTPSFATALSEVSPERRGLASGTTSMLRQLGATLGLAILGTMFLNQQASTFAKNLKHNVDTLQANPKAFQGLLAHSSRAVDALKGYSEQTQAFIKQIFANAYIQSFWSINVLAMIMALVGLAFVWLLVKKKDPPEIEL